MDERNIKEFEIQIREVLVTVRKHMDDIRSYCSSMQQHVDGLAREQYKTDRLIAEMQQIVQKIGREDSN